MHGVGRDALLRKAKGWRWSYFKAERQATRILVISKVMPIDQPFGFSFQSLLLGLRAVEPMAKAVTASQASSRKPIYPIDILSPISMAIPCWK